MASTFISLHHETGGSASGVNSFNGRDGNVTSQAGDYSAEQISYDNTDSDLTAINVQDAIDELAGQVQTGASPGFSFGRSNTVNQGTYLLCETVPSNVAGRWVYVNNAYVRKVFVANELSTTFTLDVYYHDGNNLNETLLGSVTVTSANGGVFTVNWAVPLNKQLSIKVAAGSANAAKNIVAGLELAGSI